MKTTRSFIPSRYCVPFNFLVCLFLGSQKANAQKPGPDPSKITAQTDFLYPEEKSLYQDFYISNPKKTEIKLQFQCYYYKSDNDSLLVYKQRRDHQTIDKGVHAVKIKFENGGPGNYILPSFANAVKNTGTAPIGSYKTFVTLFLAKDTLRQTFIREADSSFAITSSLRKGINNILSPVKGFMASKPKTSSSSDKATIAFEHNRFRIEKYIRKHHLTSLQYKKDSTEIIDIYSDHWFMGRYEMASNASTSASIDKERNSLKNNVNSLTQSGVESYSSLMSQFRELKKESRENAELTGEFSLAGNFASGQEPNSQQDNNYYEGRADLEFPIFDIPIQLSGYYTTQDKHRKAKSSYVHFRYDAEKAKEQLMKLISGFDKKYEEAVTQGASYDMIYGQFISGLQKEKENTIDGFKKDDGLAASGLSLINEQKLEALLKEKAKEQEDKLLDSAEHMAGNSGAANDALKQKEKAMAAKRKAEAAQAAAMEKYRKLLELEKKIQKYQALLEQYKNSNYYDSLLAYDKVKDLKNLEKMSYKDMAKKASGLLPEGKTKKMVTGLVNFDAGMFPKYVSDYTMSGQMLKGLDMSYDVGIGTLGGSYGKMEYIGRDGSVEAYKSYSGRMQFKPVYNQQFGFVYYGYSPSKSLLNDNNFFKSESVSLPSFRNPVHILSTTYEGKLSEYVSLTGEYAFSSKPKQSEEARAATNFMDRSAYNLKLEGQIPQTNISVETGYEHAGTAFENNTLPILLAGTDRLLAKAKGDFFKGFITLGAEYNYLIQRSFYSKGNNSKWGFDIATHSKRYPSFALSYKPFSTFRSFNDTLSIAQKPISGEVWTGKANYQIKRMDRAIRFTFVYSRNSSTNDTIRYKSEVTQLGTVYTKKTLMVMGTIGHSNINTDYVQTAYPIYNNSWFGNLSWSDVVKEKILLSASTDIAKAGPGISKYGCFLSGGYSFKTLPLTLRANVRYSNFRLTEVPAWQQLYSGGLELTWRIKEKLFND